MSDKLRIATIDIQFGKNYNPDQFRRMQEHINQITRLQQAFVQMLREGEDGQVLTKVGHQDLKATWADNAGGGFSITLEEGTILGRADGTGSGPPVQINIGSNLVMTGDVLSAVVPPPVVSSGGYPPQLGHAGI